MRSDFVENLHMSEGDKSLLFRFAETQTDSDDDLQRRLEWLSSVCPGYLEQPHSTIGLPRRRLDMPYMEQPQGNLRDVIRLVIESRFGL